MACDWGINTKRRMLTHWKCKTRVFPLSGTAMEHSRIPTQVWFYAMLHLANSRESVNAYFFVRHLGISLKASQRMLRRIRLHLAAVDLRRALGAPGEYLEVRVEPVRGATLPMSNRTTPASVLFIEAQGRVDSIVLDTTRRYRIRRLLLDRVRPGARVFTTCHSSWRMIHNYRSPLSSSIEFMRRRPCNESRPDGITGLLSSFRRGLRAQHQAVELQNLWLYLKEYEFRYNRRMRSQETLWDMLASFPAVDTDAERCLRRFYSDVSA